MPTPSHALEIRSLNTIRALAALLVLFSHLDNNGFGTHLKGAGQTGVLLFFCLSGFLMGHLYLAPGVRAVDLYTYGIRRFFRVYPAYAFVLIISFVGYASGLSFMFNISWERLWTQLILDGHYSIFWTIPVEMKFYLFFALFMMLASLFPDRRLIALFTLLVTAVLCLTTFGGSRTGLWTYIVPFMMGVATSRAYGVLARGRCSEAALTGIFVAALAATFLMSPKLARALLGIEIKVWAHQVATSAVMCALILTSCFVARPLRPLVENRIGDFLGAISYSLYLTHVVAAKIIAGSLRPVLGGPSLLTLPLVLALALLMAYGLHLAIERPFMALGRRLAARPPALFADRTPALRKAVPDVPSPERTQLKREPVG